MLIYNVKLNKKVIFKTALTIMSIVCISLCVIGASIILEKTRVKNGNEKIDDFIPNTEIAELTAENYTNILQMVHKNIDNYIGQKISFTGYVYKISGFDENQFVLARDMDIGNRQTLIVGFLCSSNDISNYATYTWVSITGEITKGEYNNTTIPIIKVSSIEEVSKPANPHVPMPDDTYVPTAVIY